MRSEPTWLSVESIIGINRLICARDGNHHAVSSHHLVASAVEAPINYWHYQQVDDLAALAALLALRVAKNHGFMDGNKRTAFMGMNAFLGLNSVGLYIFDERVNTDMMVGLETGAVPLPEFTEWLRGGMVVLG